MSVDLINFDAPPEIGTVIGWHGRTYRLAEVEPYQRKDGQPSHILWWVGECQTCGGEFRSSSGVFGIKPLNARCQVHHAPLRPATPQARAARNRGKAIGRKQTHAR